MSKKCTSSSGPGGHALGLTPVAPKGRGVRRGGGNGGGGEGGVGAVRGDGYKALPADTSTALRQLVLIAFSSNIFPQAAPAHRVECTWVTTFI
jgi:hypothetical protein